jgi:hypothetical protein
MAHPEQDLVPAVPVDDGLGIIYLIESAQQFWSGECLVDHSTHPLIETFSQNSRTSSSYPATNIRPWFCSMLLFGGF